MTVHVVKVPDIGEGIAEVEVAEWYVKPGDTIKADQTVADLMTDKATVEVPSPISGRVVSLGGKAGDKLAVGAELIRLESDAAGMPEAVEAAATATAPAAAGKPAAPPSKPAATTPVGASAPSTAAATASPTPVDKPLASPSVECRSHRSA